MRQAEQAERDTAKAEADIALAAAETQAEATFTIATVRSGPEPEPDAQRTQRQQAKAERRQQRADAKAAKQAAAPDPLVEPPPAIGEDASTGSARRAIAVTLLVLGALGLLCSMILAVGALLAAVEADTSGVAGTVSGICDVLVGPLDGLFDFTGRNADSKADLIARGIASMGYLGLGLGLPMLARRGDA